MPWVTCNKRPLLFRWQKATNTPERRGLHAIGYQTPIELALRQTSRDGAGFHTWTDDPNFETIRLKDNKGGLRDYEGTTETQRMRGNLDRINSVLESAQITIPAEAFDNDAVAAQTYERVQQGVRLYRTFKGNAFDSGGRFYGGWWIQHLKKQRPSIQINGLPTVEADYRGLYAAILFAEHGIAIPDDPYSAVPDLSHGKDPNWRKAVKTTFNAMLNAAGRLNEPSEFDLTPYSITKQDFQQMIRDAFPAFHAEFRSNAWGRLQRAESDLMEAVLLHFSELGIPVLPIHDGAIVQADRGEDLRDTMQAVFMDRYGQRPSVRLK